MQIHETDKPSDYGVARATCTATLATEQAVADWRRSLEGRRAAETYEKTGFDPARADAWYSYTTSEGVPTFERETITDE